MIYPSRARQETMAIAFAELDKVKEPTICEVGRARSLSGGETDGHSTLVFADYLNTHARAGWLFSIDSDPATQATCHQLLGERGVAEGRISYINMDALNPMCHPVPPLDLLYLDGWDWPGENGHGSAVNHLHCFIHFDHLIKPGGLLLIDDTGYPDLGKGKLVVPVAVLMGWTVLHQGFQTLLRKP